MAKDEEVAEKNVVEIREAIPGNKELTMVHPNIIAARPAAESTSFWLFRWKIFMLAALLTLTALFISRVGPSGVEESENKLKIKPPSSFRHQQDLNHRPVDEECEHAVNRLVSNGILLAAFDFDATILDFHTGGQWEGNTQDLVSHVRPEFKCYISLCLDKGIRVAVATFSAQTRMIAKVLEDAIPHSRAKDIVVFGWDDHVKGYSKGKQSQLFLAMDRFNIQQAPSRGRATPITPRRTVLIDDDPENINVAIIDGYKTIQFHPDSLSKTLMNAPII